MDFLRLPFFDAIADAQTILLAGAGGGYDIFTGLPLYFGLRRAGKTVHLANLSFSQIYGSTGKRLGQALMRVTRETEGSVRYFPEVHLAQWLHAQKIDAPIYCFDRTGARPITTAYKNLVEHLGGVDAVILMDGGTDSLLRGDEFDLGTPEEDSASLCAVDALDVPTKLLMCVGFGVDTFHGVCHVQFLEAVAAIAREGGFLGAWSLTPEMPEVVAYKQAVEWVHQAMFNNPSIVNSSLVAAIDGQFGNYHANFRTEGSELFINALMSLYWGFQFEPVARRNLYLDAIRDTESYFDLTVAITKFRAGQQGKIKEWQSLPM